MSPSKSGEIFAGTYYPPEHLWLAVHFSPSAAGRAVGLAFLERKLRRKDRDPEVSEVAAASQREAIGKYIVKGDGALNYLKDIRQPTLIAQGSNDVIIPTLKSLCRPASRLASFRGSLGNGDIVELRSILAWRLRGHGMGFGCRRFSVRFWCASDTAMQRAGCSIHVTSK